MATRGSAYSSKSDGDSIEDLSARLTADLRKNIRALGPYPVLSEKWAEMSRSLARIANISQMERDLPKKEDATLWECEELALRYVLEDGKLNLCLRLLEEYMEVAREVSSGARSVSPEQAELLDKFEQGLGQLLANAWLHVEALQTTDLPLMIRLISDSFRSAIAASGESDPYKHRLPATSVHFMYTIGKALDELGESRVFPELIRQESISLLVLHLSANYSRMTAADHLVAAKALAGFAAAEDFGTKKSTIMGNDEVAAALVSLEDAFVAELSSDLDTRRVIRPLLDLIASTKRGLSK